MEQANIPKQEELSALYGSWNPMGYMQGQANQDLASQFRAQAYAKNAQDLQTTQQTYDQAELMNPLRVQELQGNVTGKGYENTSAGLKAERETLNQPAAIAKQIRQAALDMNEDEIKQYDQRVTKLFQSGNPQDIALATKMQEFQQVFMAERRKAADAVALENVKGKWDLQRVGATNTSNKDLEQMRIDAGKYDSKKFSLSVSNRISAAKNPMEKMEILEDAYATAISQGDVAASAEYAKRYKAAQLRHAEQERLKANAKTTIDMNQFGTTSAPPTTPTAPISLDAGKLEGDGSAAKPFIIN